MRSSRSNDRVRSLLQQTVQKLRSNGGAPLVRTLKMVFDAEGREITMARIPQHRQIPLTVIEQNLLVLVEIGFLLEKCLGYFQFFRINPHKIIQIKEFIMKWENLMEEIKKVVMNG